MYTTIGAGTTYEIIYIAHIATDQDGSLKIKRIEDFMDTNVFLELQRLLAPAIAAAQASNNK